MSAVWRGCLALVLAALGQFLLNRYVPEAGKSVDLFTVMVVYYAVTRRRTTVMLLGATAGLLQDAVVHTFLGMNAFKKTLIGYLAGSLGSVLVLSQPLPRFAVLFVATILEALTETALHLVLGQNARVPTVGNLIRLGLGNGVVGTLIFWVISRLEYRNGLGLSQQQRL